MPRFVILSHDWPFPHYDLMLESGESLRTWRLALPPDPDTAVAAEPLANHRLAYLSFEGPLSDNRGRVSRWDSGTFEWECDTAELVRIRAAGKRISGQLELAKARRGSTPPSPPRLGGGWGGSNREPIWICRFTPDSGV